ncbi:MAG: DUF4153 domain-containing protein [Acutalibacteraceae bacterium]
MNELNKRSAERFSSADWITAPIITIITYIIVRVFFNFFDDCNIGNFVFTFSAGYFLILVTAFIYTKKDRRLNAESVLTAVCCAVLGFSVSLYGDIIFSFFTVLLLFALSASLCLSLSGSHAFSSSSAYYLFDVLCTLTISPLKNFAPMMKSAFSGRKKSKRVSSAVLGIIFAIPVLAVVIVLLTKGDAAFENLTSKVVDVLFSGYGFASVLVTIVLAIYIFTVMYASRNSLAVSNPEKARQTVSGFHSMPVSMINGFSGAISAVYVVYLLSQLTYFFGAFGGKIPDSVKMTVAEYSRRGFFEMSAVAFINLVLIFIAVMLSKRTDGKIAKSVKGVSLFLCVFTEILIITAMSKMVLYISRYGLTRKRVFVTAAIVVMFVTFICVIIRLFKQKFPYMKIVFSVFLVMYSLLSVVNVNALIANINVDAYLSGRLNNVDTEMLSYFGTAGVKPLMKLTKCSDSDVSNTAKNRLGEMFSYNNCGVFEIDDESGEISLSEGGSGIYDYVVLNSVRSDKEEYMKIVNEVNPKPLDCYVFVSTDSICTLIQNEFYTAENSEDVFEKYKLYKMPVSSEYEVISLYTEFESAEYEYNCELKDCKAGGVIEICEDKDGKIIYNSYGKPGISFPDAQKIMEKVKNSK